MMEMVPTWQRAKSLEESISRLSEVNNAEWQRTQEFLAHQNNPPKLTDNDQEVFAHQSWKSIHAKALENDAEGVSDFIMGRRGATLTVCDAQTNNGWSALHVASIAGANRAAATCIEGQADVFLQVFSFCVVSRKYSRYYITIYDLPTNARA